MQTLHRSIMILYASIVSVHGPLWLHFKASTAIEFRFDADPDPAFDFDADPDPTFLF